MSAQILTREGWTNVSDLRFVAFDFEGGTVAVEAQIDGRIRQMDLPRTHVRMGN